MIAALLLQSAGGGSALVGLMPIVLMVAVFYFLLLAPQQRRQKKWQAMVSDLKAGTHLILQVMVNDAINADSDRLVDRLKVKFADKHVAYGDIVKPDPQHPETIVVKGVAPDAVGAVRDILADEREYDYTSGA